jgi:hypothetical protein
MQRVQGGGPLDGKELGVHGMLCKIGRKRSTIGIQIRWRSVRCIWLGLISLKPLHAIQSQVNALVCE